MSFILSKPIAANILQKKKKKVLALFCPKAAVHHIVACRSLYGLIQVCRWK